MATNDILSKAIEYKLVTISTTKDETLKKYQKMKTIDTAMTTYKKQQEINIDYEYIQLTNKLKVLLCHIENATTFGACMRVNVGSVDNPNGYDGLAHFLEHMLFMGSQKYQKESLFMDTVLNNGGMTNAYTADNETVYYFTMGSEIYFAALDIFAHFFIDPTFNIKYVEKELNAIDSEHNKNIGDDFYRRRHLTRLFYMNPDYKKFSTGTKKSLLMGDAKGNYDTLRDEMVKFHDKYYTANNMFLIICDDGRNSDKLMKSIDVFGKIKTTVNNTPRRALCRTHKYKHKYEIIEMKSTITFACNIQINWVVRQSLKCKNNMYNGAIDLLKYILRNVSAGSLNDMLVNNGYRYISTMTFYVGNDFGNNILLSLHINASKESIHKWREILCIVHNYIADLAKYFHDDSKFSKLLNEFRTLKIIGEQIVENADSESLMMALNDTYGYDIEPNYCPIYPLLMENEQDVYANFIDMLGQMKIQNSKTVIITTHDLPKNRKILTDEYYDTQYVYIRKKITENRILNFIKKLHHLRDFPYNPYVLSTIKILNTTNNQNKLFERISTKNANNVVYLLTGNKFKSPLYTICLSIYLDEVAKDVNRHIALQLYANYITYKNRGKFQQMGNAMYKIDWALSRSGNKLFCSAQGHSSLMAEVLKEQLTFMLNPPDEPIDTEIYKVIFDVFAAGHYDLRKESPFIQAKEEVVTVNDSYISYYDIISSIPTFSPTEMNKKENVINFDSLFSIVRCYMTPRSIAQKDKQICDMKCIAGGSVDIDQLSEIVNYVENELYKKKIGCDVIRNDLAAQKGENKSECSTLKFEQHMTENLFRVNTNSANNDIAIVYGIYLECVDMFDSKKYVDVVLRQMFISIYSAHAFFDEIRTQGTMGYIAKADAFSSTLCGKIHSFLKFLIQSNKHHGICKIDDYINKLVDSLSNITDDIYIKVINAIENRLREVFMNTFDEINFYFMRMDCIDFAHQDAEQNAFDSINISLQRLRTLKKKEIIEPIINAIVNNYRFIINIIPVKRFYV